MPKSIVLVGANGSGKSTLGKKLSEILDLKYNHAGPSPGGTVEAFDCCIKQLDLLKQGVILDRVTPICRRVYEVPLTQEEQVFLRRFTDHVCKHANIIFCTGEGEFTNKDYYPPGHYEEVLKNKDAIRLRYDRIMSGLPHVTYDWTKDSIGQLLEKLRNV